MDIYQVTALLREAVRDEGASLAERYGADAGAVAQQMIELLQERFERQGPYLSLWRDFENAYLYGNAAPDAASNLSDADD
jgi:hypothetical protein